MTPYLADARFRDMVTLLVFIWGLAGIGAGSVTLGWFLAVRIPPQCQSCTLVADPSTNDKDADKKPRLRLSQTLTN
jgi:hypothetical protein